jgi:YfiH family protein
MNKPLPYFRPTIFDQFSDVVAAHSLRDSSQPNNFSMTAGGATPEIAATNLNAFAKLVGFPDSQLATLKQEHGDGIYELAGQYDQHNRPTSDALITNQVGWLVGVRVADCIAVLVYDPANQAIAVIHSGWRGTASDIVSKTIQSMQARYGSQPDQLYAYISPAPNRYEYEVGLEVAEQFAAKYCSPKSADKAWFDNKLTVHDQLLTAGLAPNHIEVDPRSTIADPRFHSYRRDHEESGRMIVAIGLKEPGHE